MCSTSPFIFCRKPKMPLLLLTPSCSQVGNRNSSSAFHCKRRPDIQTAIQESHKRKCRFKIVEAFNAFQVTNIITCPCIFINWNCCKYLLLLPQFKNAPFSRSVSLFRILILLSLKRQLISEQLQVLHLEVYHILLSLQRSPVLHLHGSAQQLLKQLCILGRSYQV